MIQAKLKPNNGNKNHEFILSLAGSLQRVDIRDWRDDYFVQLWLQKLFLASQLPRHGHPYVVT